MVRRGMEKTYCRKGEKEGRREGDAKRRRGGQKRRQKGMRTTMSWAIQRRTRYMGARTCMSVYVGVRGAS